MSSASDGPPPPEPAAPAGGEASASPGRESPARAGGAGQEAPAGEEPPAPPGGAGQEAGRAGTGAVLSGRLHPAVLVIWPFSQVLPLAFLLLTDTVAAGFAAVALAVTVGAGLARWLRFSWRLADGALVIEQGLLSRQRRVIPVERIQSVDLVRRVRHRVFGVVEVRVEAVGGSDTEGRIDALSAGEAERLRAALLAARQGRTFDAAAPGAGTPVDHLAGTALPGRQLVRMTPQRLVLAGLTGGRVGVAAALLGGLQQLFGDRVEQLFTTLPEQFSLRALIGLGVAVLVGAFVLSVVVTAVAYWDFTLARDDGELRVRRGLLEQRLETIPLRRVQALRIEQNLLRRPFGLASVKVDVAGKAGGSDARDTGLLLPLGTSAEAHELVAELLERPGLTAVALTPSPPAALRRRLARAVWATLVPTAAATALLGPPGLAVALLGVPAVLLAVGAYRALGAGELAGVAVTRSGVLVRRTAFVPVHNLQSLAVTASPFQRRAGLATLELQIPRSPGVWGGPQLLDVERERADAVLHRLAAELVGEPRS